MLAACMQHGGGGDRLCRDVCVLLGAVAESCEGVLKLHDELALVLLQLADDLLQLVVDRCQPEFPLAELPVVRLAVNEFLGRRSPLSCKRLIALPLRRAGAPTMSHGGRSPERSIFVNLAAAAAAAAEDAKFCAVLKVL